MTVARRRPKMKRTQISLLPEQLEAARRIAARRGVSLSQVFRDAIECVEAPVDIADEIEEPLAGIIGIITNADPDGSEAHDEAIYGQRVR